MLAKLIPPSNFSMSLSKIAFSAAFAALFLAACSPASPPTGQDYPDQCRSCIDPDSFDPSRKIVCRSSITNTDQEFVLVEENVTFRPGSVSGYDPRVELDSTCKDTSGNPVKFVYRGAGYCSLGGSTHGKDLGDFEIRFKLREPRLPDPEPLRADDPVDIYARPDVPLPDFLNCEKTTDDGQNFKVQGDLFSARQAGGMTAQAPAFISGSPGYGAFAAAGILPNPPSNFITYDGKNWQFFRDVSADRATELASSPPPLAGTPPTTNVSGTDLEVYYNLIKGVDSHEVIFLIEPGSLDPSGPDPLPFLEYHLSTETDVGGGGLQLESFNPIACKETGWWTCWVILGKPVIYLYPERPTRLSLKLTPLGRLSRSDPPYDPAQGWRVTALPGGAIQANDATYPYLYYEVDLFDYRPPDQGFVVKTEAAAAFLRQTLPKLGLLEHEINDFEDYWLPRLRERDTPYFFVTFLPPEEIERIDRVDLSQKPETEIRITALFRGLDQPLKVNPLPLPEKPPERKGFTLVEWGGIME
jgi:hypothetical protein